MKIIRNSLFLLSSVLVFSCNGPDQPSGDTSKQKAKPSRPKPEWKKPSRDGYHFESVKSWMGKGRHLKDTAGIDVILAVNRTDSANLPAIDSILVPDDLSGDVASYMHFPETVSSLSDVSKIVFFSYPSQTFAAYEYGNLVQAGPTNMGRKKDPTPTGLFFSNWKAVETTSTFNDEWNLRWNFNIQNKEGIGWHQYALPGYPASHSCLRLQTNDAKKLYEWADQWTLDGPEKVLANGTPAIVFGSYPFDGPKPWLALVNDPKALAITESAVNGLVKPQLEKILAEQAKTEKYRDTPSK
ncbi:MAG: murein L,D-transpeptidase [Chitinophagaceae bacterium]|nr:MAG: murein L,D-transpeptidase [Chitinophagaceae bacterium]